MNEATKLMCELLCEDAYHIWETHLHTDLLLEDFAKQYFLKSVEEKIEDDLYGVLLQEIIHQVDWSEVRSQIIENIDIEDRYDKRGLHRIE